MDIIFDKKKLAEYLGVSVSTISKLVSNKQIPYFKMQAGQSGAVRFRQQEIEKWILQKRIPDINPFPGKLS
jgi:excisionase family DNA binding protein